MAKKMLRSAEKLSEPFTPLSVTLYPSANPHFRRSWHRRLSLSYVCNPQRFLLIKAGFFSWVLVPQDRLNYPKLLGGPRTPPFGPFLCTRFEKSENLKIKTWSLRNDFRDAAQFRYKSQKWKVKNSFFEGHEMI